MSKLSGSIIHVRLLDDLARQDSPVHQLHPLTKLLTTLAYLVVVVSFGRYAVIELFPFFLFPMLSLILADIPPGLILKRVLLVEPLILGIGILNPLFDRQMVEVGGYVLAGGWLTFVSILLKSSLTVSVSLILIATTGMDHLGAALRLLRVPRLFVLQLLLTYRYIAVLGEEAGRMHRAYSLRAPGSRGLQRAVWGSFTGQLVLRTFDRAQRVYQAMTLRGFDGEYHTGLPYRSVHEAGGYGKSAGKHAAGSRLWLNGLYFLAWFLFFLACRFYNLPALLGTWLAGIQMRIAGGLWR